MVDSADFARSPVGDREGWLRGASPGLRVAVAAAAPPGSPLRDRLPEIALGVRSWSAALSVAREQRLDGFLAHWIWTSGRALVPADMLPKLEARLFALARRERLLLAEQSAIRSALSARGIASLPYKGPSLAGRLYDPSFLRYSRDIDILVPPERVDEAIRSLEADYETIREHAEGGSDDETEHHQLIRHRESGVLVEVHWSLAPARWGLATAELVGPPGSWPPADAGPEDGWPLPRLLPVVAAHGVRHGYSRLVWLADVARILSRHPDLDWDATWRAAATGCETALGASLLLAERIFAARLPAAARRRASSVASRTLVSWLERRVAAGRNVWDPVARGLLQAISADGWSRRTKLATRFALRPTALDRAALPLPAGMQWLHAPLRPALLVSRFLARRARSSAIAPGPGAGPEGTAHQDRVDRRG